MADRVRCDGMVGGMTTTRTVPKAPRSDYYVITPGGHVRAKLVRIGNSKGVRLPKAMIEEAGLGDELEISVRKGEIVIARVKKVREGWAEDARLMAKLEKGTFVQPPPTNFMLYEQEWPGFE